MRCTVYCHADGSFCQNKDASIWCQTLVAAMWHVALLQILCYSSCSCCIKVRPLVGTEGLVMRHDGVDFSVLFFLRQG